MTELQVLIVTAASIGFVHTLLGPDHYLPFVALSKARGWSARRTAGITALCGLGHVLSSVLIGAAGLAIGSAVEPLIAIESFRGDIAAWLLFGFGLAYLAWGAKRALRSGQHSHDHVHVDGTRHSHPHQHFHGHVHPHAVTGTVDLRSGSPWKALGVAPWMLFIIFVFGPCEPLIPVLMYPAAQSSALGVGLVSLSFGLATLGAMLLAVFVLRAGLRGLNAERLQPWSQAIAGGTLAACGASILFLGL